MLQQFSRITTFRIICVRRAQLHWPINCTQSNTLTVSQEEGEGKREGGRKEGGGGREGGRRREGGKEGGKSKRGKERET